MEQCLSVVDCDVVEWLPFLLLAAAPEEERAAFNAPR